MLVCVPITIGIDSRGLTPAILVVERFSNLSRQNKASKDAYLERLSTGFNVIRVSNIRMLSHKIQF